jgi:hypothetical protein
MINPTHHPKQMTGVLEAICPSYTIAWLEAFVLEKPMVLDDDVVPRVTVDSGDRLRPTSFCQEVGLQISPNTVC